MPHHSGRLESRSRVEARDLAADKAFHTDVPGTVADSARDHVLHRDGQYQG